MTKKILLSIAFFFALLSAWEWYARYDLHNGPKYMYVEKENQAQVFYIDYWIVRPIEINPGFKELYMELVSNEVTISIPMQGIYEIRLNEDEPKFFVLRKK